MQFTEAGPPFPLKLSHLSARWNRAKQIIISLVEFVISQQDALIAEECNTNLHKAAALNRKACILSCESYAKDYL